MSLKYMDGMATIDGANNAVDIPVLLRTNTTVNSTSVDMSEHHEFLAVLQVGAVETAANVTVVVQESNESAANFTNITGATTGAVNTANTQSMVDVNWKDTRRRRFARLQSITGTTNNATFGATSLRLNKSGDQSADAALVEVT